MLLFGHCDLRALISVPYSLTTRSVLWCSMSLPPACTGRSSHIWGQIEAVFNISKYIQLQVSLPVKKSLSRAQNGGHFENLEILNTASIDLRYEKIIPNYAKKVFFVMMTSSMTSQGGLKLGPLYSSINRITFFMITELKRTKISSLNFLCIGIMRLWLYLYKSEFMTSLMTSPGHKVGQFLELMYLHQYFS